MGLPEGLVGNRGGRQALSRLHARRLPGQPQQHGTREHSSPGILKYPPAPNPAMRGPSKQPRPGQAWTSTAAHLPRDLVADGDPEVAQVVLAPKDLQVPACAGRAQAWGFGQVSQSGPVRLTSWKLRRAAAAAQSVPNNRKGAQQPTPCTACAAWAPTVGHQLLDQLVDLLRLLALPPPLAAGRCNSATAVVQRAQGLSGSRWPGKL